MPATINEIDQRLGAGADEVRANSELTVSKCSVGARGVTVLGHAERSFAEGERGQGARDTRRVSMVISVRGGGE